MTNVIQNFEFGFHKVENIVGKRDNAGFLLLTACCQTPLSLELLKLAVFILGSGIAGIPHFCKKSSKLSDTVRDKSPTFTHVAIIFKIRLIFLTL